MAYYTGLTSLIVALIEILVFQHSEKTEYYALVGFFDQPFLAIEIIFFDKVVDLALSKFGHF